MMNFKQAEERFKQLEDQFAAGKLSEIDFKTQLKELMFQDNRGSWWIIGYETKKWYRHNGKEWVKANPRAEQYITYGIIALVVIIVMLGLWGIISSLGSSNINGEPGPTGLPGPTGPAATPADSTCAGCHNDAGIIAVKREGWQASAHGNGTVYLEEFGNQTCSFCHTGSSFSAAVAAGTNFSNQEAAATEPSRQNCYTCHQIHVTNTSADWALETDAPVTLVTSGATFDGGSGNLCANCHQARRYMANFASKDSAGVVIPDKFTPTIRYNTHYSVQVDTLMATVDVNVALGVDGKPGAHYSMVENTCVGCHMGEANNHSFTPQVANCVVCHADAVSTDINGAVTAFEEKVTQLHDALVAKGLMNDDSSNVLKNADGSPVQLDPPQAAALFVYHLIEDDGSESVHNPNYFNALVDASLAVLAE